MVCSAREFWLELDADVAKNDDLKSWDRFFCYEDVTTLIGVYYCDHGTITGFE